jgi:hypothetical protein
MPGVIHSHGLEAVRAAGFALPSPWPDVVWRRLMQMARLAQRCGTPEEVNLLTRHDPSTTFYKGQRKEDWPVACKE